MHTHTMVFRRIHAKIIPFTEIHTYLNMCLELRSLNFQAVIHLLFQFFRVIMIINTFFMATT